MFDVFYSIQHFDVNKGRESEREILTTNMVQSTKVHFLWMYERQSTMTPWSWRTLEL